MKKILVLVTPNAKVNEIQEVSDKVLKVKVSEPPVDGRANRAIVKILAKHYKVHRSDILILEGMTQRKKVIGINLDE